MTIYLPENITLFCQTFDEICDRILRSENDAAFYILFVELIVRLREHPLFRDYILGLEVEFAKENQKFNAAALEALEDGWIRLWKYHCHSLNYRKRLVRIKRMITVPDKIAYSTLYLRILFSLTEFRYDSPFCRFINEAPKLFCTAQSKLHLESLLFTYSYPSLEGYFSQRKVIRLKLVKKDKLQHLHRKIFSFGLQENPRPFKWSAECATSVIDSPKIVEIEKKFAVLLRGDKEKQKNINIMTEISPSFCWGRVRFLQQTYLLNDTVLPVKTIKGRWTSIREDAWQSALERNESLILIRAKMALSQALSAKSDYYSNVFLMPEHQIQRKDYEKYLKSLKNHIQIQLFKMQDEQTTLSTTQPIVTVPQSEQVLGEENERIERENFVIDHAKKYRIKLPLETHKNMFNNYKTTCPKRLAYALTKWKEIIKNHHLDPRTHEEKKKNSGRPSKK